MGQSYEGIHPRRWQWVIQHGAAVRKGSPGGSGGMRWGGVKPLSQQKETGRRAAGFMGRFGEDPAD